LSHGKTATKNYDWGQFFEGVKMAKSRNQIGKTEKAKGNIYWDILVSRFFC
jgi:hypothetical protein